MIFDHSEHELGKKSGTLNVQADSLKLKTKGKTKNKYKKTFKTFKNNENIKV